MKTMRRFAIIAVLFALGFVSYAQSEYDVHKYSQADMVGTARYMGLAGAFGALGGDMSAVSQNPGGIGVYRSSELSITPFVGHNTVTTDFQAGNRKEGKLDAGLNSLGLIGSFRPYNSETVNNINVGVSYARTRDFDRNTFISGKNRTYSLLDKVAADYENVPEHLLSDLGLLVYEAALTNHDNGVYTPILVAGELVDNSFYMSESGFSGVIDFTLGANWGHFMYVGLGIGLNMLDYEMMSSYKEVSHGTDEVLPIEYELRNALSTSGTGVSLKVGAIIRPFSFLRFGLALHSPTYYSMTDAFGSSITSDLAGGNNYSVSTEEDVMDYQVQTPGKIMYSMAYLFGQKGLISFDCDVLDYRDMNARSSGGMPNDRTNDAIDSHFKAAYNFRVGGEYRVGDNISLRAGFANYAEGYDKSISRQNTPIRTVGTTPHYATDKATSYVTGGVGYRSGAFTLDVAVTERMSGEHFFPFYDNSPSVTGVSKFADVKLNRLTMALTAGIRF